MMHRTRAMLAAAAAICLMGAGASTALADDGRDERRSRDRQVDQSKRDARAHARPAPRAQRGEARQHGAQRADRVRTPRAADRSRPVRRAPSPRPTPQVKKNHFDVNGDGVISVRELEAYNMAKRERLRGADRPGVRGPGGPAWRPRPLRRPAAPGVRRPGQTGAQPPAQLKGQIMKKFDADNDGVLSEAESLKLREAVRRRRFSIGQDAAPGLDRPVRPGAPGYRERAADARQDRRQSGNRALRSLDLDGSGGLSVEEARRGAQLIQSGDPAADFNGDGVVNEADAHRLADVLRKSIRSDGRSSAGPSRRPLSPSARQLDRSRPTRDARPTRERPRDRREFAEQPI